MKCMPCFEGAQISDLNKGMKSVFAIPCANNEINYIPIKNNQFKNMRTNNITLTMHDSP